MIKYYYIDKKNSFKHNYIDVPLDTIGKILYINNQSVTHFNRNHTYNIILYGY